MTSWAYIDRSAFVMLTVGPSITRVLADRYYKMSYTRFLHAMWVEVTVETSVGTVELHIVRTFHFIRVHKGHVEQHSDITDLPPLFR